MIKIFIYQIGTLYKLIENFSPVFYFISSRFLSIAVISIDFANFNPGEVKPDLEIKNNLLFSP